MLSGLRVLKAFAEKPAKATINGVYLQEIDDTGNDPRAQGIGLKSRHIR